MVAQLDRDYCTTRPARALARLLSYAAFEGRPLTTRGRWINPLLEAAGRRIARGADRQVQEPLFILGTGRSGTTVLGKILSLHRHVGWLNEPKLMWHIACEHEDLNGNYTLEPARYRLEADDADAATQQAMHSLYHSYLSATRNRRVLDKYPELVFRVPFVQRIFPDARFVLLLRNGYDTCRSISRWSASHGNNEAGVAADWWGLEDRKWHCLVDELVRSDPALAPNADTIATFSDHTHRAAVEWDLSMREAMRVAGELPDATLRVRYEDLLAAPADTVSDILKFAGLAHDQTVLDYAARTLRPRRRSTPAGETLQLPSAIAGSFGATMRALGYTSDTGP